MGVRKGEERISGSDVDEFAEKAREWLDSQPGLEAILRALKEAEGVSEQMEKGWRIKPERLNKPVTL